MSVLGQICEKKRVHIEVKEAQMPLETLKVKINDAPPVRSFQKQIRDFISRGMPALISEVKKASPSKGIIREDFNPVDIAQNYENAGAACISVLTDTPYFMGQDQDLIDVRAHTNIPLLRKDFMLTPYQIYESRILGADCILLIMAALEDGQAEELYHLTRELGMDALFEVHDEQELDRAMILAPEIVGINSRNLKTLDVDLKTAVTLSGKLPEHVIRVAESGIYTHEDIQNLQHENFQAFLVGESLMREQDIGKAVKKLLNTAE